MSILDNGTWIDYLNPVIESLRSYNVDIKPANEDKLKRIAEDASKFLKNHFKDMDHSKVKIAGALAYYFNEWQPLEGKPNSISVLSKRAYCMNLNAIVAQRLAMLICEHNYFYNTSKRMHINMATRREWQRLLRFKDEKEFQPKFSHFAMIMMLCKYLDGNFPGRNHPW